MTDDTRPSPGTTDRVVRLRELAAMLAEVRDGLRSLADDGCEEFRRLGDDAAALHNDVRQHYARLMNWSWESMHI